MSTLPQPSFVVPELLQGQWTTALVCTFGANLTFFENRLMSQLAQVPLRIILADNDQLSSTFGEAARTGQRHRLANKAYVAAPIRHPRAAHGKLILLLGLSTGRLVVGSGNLGYDGYASPGELWHVFAYSDEQPQHLNEFAAARSFVDELATRGLIDPPVIELLQSAWGRSTWLPEVPGEPTVIGGNFEQSILERLRSAVSVPVNELIAHAPFHDAECAALYELIGAFNPEQVRLLVTDATSADPKAIERVLGVASKATVEQVHVKDEPAAYIHAKWVHIIHQGSETLLTGSANLSRSALLRSAATGNIEIGVLSTGPRGSFDSLYTHLQRTEVKDFASLAISYQPGTDGGAEEGDASFPVVLWSSLDGAILTIVFSEPLPKGIALDITDHAGRTLKVDSEQLAGSIARITLAQGAAALASDSGRLVIRIDRDNEQISFTWPYHVQHLRGRLDKTGQQEHLPGLGELPGQDAELYELLRELDQTLIIDRESVWRIATPNFGRKKEPVHANESVRLEDLDWERVRRDPRYGGYFTRARATGLPPTDIQVVLAAIGGRLGDLGLEVGRLDAEQEEDLAKEGDVGLSAESDEVDDDELEDELTRKRLPVSTRTRMAFNRFVRRYAAALDDSAFINELGPIPASINAVVFNHLLVRLLERDAVSPRWAIDAQVKTWAFLWGSPELLDDETAAVVRGVLDEAGARGATLRGIAASFDYTLDEEVLARLRDEARHVLTNDEFALDGDGLAAAAGGPPMAPGLLYLLARAAAPTTSAEILDYVVAPYGIARSSVRWRREQVRRIGRGTYQSTTLVVTAPVEGLNVDRAHEILGRVAVAAHYAGHDDAYFRIRFEGNGKAVAFWDEDASRGVAVVGDDDRELERIEPSWPAWAVRVKELEAQLGELATIGKTA